MLTQKGEMKRKLAGVTLDIYNSLDLLVGSAEFSQVCRHWFFPFTVYCLNREVY